MSKIENKTTPPADVLEALAREMHIQYQNSSQAMEVDLFYAIMNRKTYKLSYCSAGRIDSFVYCFSTKEVRELKPSADYFNKGSAHEFSNQKISFNPRDRLILCTPGVVETLNQKGEPFGKERLKQTIQSVRGTGPHQLRSEIFYALKSFSQRDLVKRDQSVIVMEIKDRILKLA